MIYLRIIEIRVNPPISLARGIAARMGKVSAGLIRLRITNSTNPILGLFIHRIENKMDRSDTIIKTAST